MHKNQQIIKNEIMALLLNQYHGANPSIIEISENTFKYQLERNDNYSYFSVGFTIDSAGILKVNFKESVQFML
jgi:hypothetical protein